MIKMMIRAGNVFTRFISLFLAAAFFLYGFLSVAGSFRQELWAVSRPMFFKPDKDSNDYILPDFNELTALNTDITAWLKIYGTKIDYPVLQGRSDMEYLNKDVYGSYSMSGSIFLSVLNDRDYSGSYQLIYGHHMENGSMFGELDKFSDKEFFFDEREETPGDSDGMLMTEDSVMELKAFALIKTDAFDPMIYDADKTPDETEELMEYAEKKALYFKNIDDTDHVIALTTCDSGFSYGRTVLLCSAKMYDGPLAFCDPENADTEKSAAVYYHNEGEFAVINLLILIAGLYLSFPFHLVREIGLGRYRFLNSLCLLSGAASAAVFIISEDLNGRALITDSRTPVMLMLLFVIWLIRYGIYLKCKS